MRAVAVPVLLTLLAGAASVPDGGAVASSIAASAVPRSSKLSIAPLSVDLLDGKRSGIVKIVNAGQWRSTVQLRLYRWRQQGDKDELVPANALVVSPAITTIEAGAAQQFRLLVTDPAAVQGESYRLIVDELPDAETPAGPQVRLRFSLPIFREASADAPELRYRAVAGGLRIHNVGTRHARLHSVTLQLADGRELTGRTQGPGYVLPGVERSWNWPVDMACLPEGARLVVSGERISDNVQLAPNCS